jgi:hypothetical protein
MLIYIHEVPGLILDRGTDYPNWRFSWFPSVTLCLTLRAEMDTQADRKAIWTVERVEHFKDSGLVK